MAESVDVLHGGGPADVVALTVALAEEMLALAGIDADPAAVLALGAAYPGREAMIAAQGGDPAAPLPVAQHVEELRAHRPVCSSGATRSARRAGGWAQAGPEVPDPAAGRRRRPGGRRAAVELHTDTPAAVASALAALRDGVVVGDGPAPPRPPLIGDTLRP